MAERSVSLYHLTGWRHKCPPASWCYLSYAKRGSACLDNHPGDSWALKKACGIFLFQPQKHEITDAGVRSLKGQYGTVFVDIQAGLFNLPKSFSVFLLTLAEERSTPKNLTFLQGCWLIRPNTSRVDVTAHGNQEPHMWIVSATGEILVQQAFTQTKASKKKREHDALGGGEPAAKMQRVA